MGEFFGSMCDIKLAERVGGCTEGVGCDDIRARLVIVGMDLFDDVWTRETKNIGAVFATQVVRFDIQIVTLRLRTHRAIPDEDFPIEEINERWILWGAVHGLTISDYANQRMKPAWKCKKTHICLWVMGSFGLHQRVINYLVIVFRAPFPGLRLRDPEALPERAVVFGPPLGYPLPFFGLRGLLAESRFEFGDCAALVLCFLRYFGRFGFELVSFDFS